MSFCCPFECDMLDTVKFISKARKAEGAQTPTAFIYALLIKINKGGAVWVKRKYWY